MKKKALFLLGDEAFEKIYGPREREQIGEMVDLIGEPQTADSIGNNDTLLKEVEIIFSGWGMVPLDGEFLSRAPRLEAVFYGAGSIRYFMTDAAWDRNIIVTSSYAANAIPVAEFCAASLIMGLKQAPFFMSRLAGGSREEWTREGTTIHGAYGSTVGLVSLGMIGKHVLRLMKNFNTDILVYSQSMTPERAKEEGVESVSLEELFRRSDAISIHTADLPETRGMITGELIASMKKGAILVNTSRGAVIEEKRMIEVLERRPDLTALLDVTDPEPPVDGSPLYSLPNVFLTPHVAGSLERECRRMGQYAVDDCRRYLEGKALAYGIDRKTFERMA